jgi:hypothetical protein
MLQICSIDSFPRRINVWIKQEEPGGRWEVSETPPEHSIHVGVSTDGKKEQIAEEWACSPDEVAERTETIQVTVDESRITQI